MEDLLNTIGPGLWAEARTACARGPGWVVLVASAEEARLLALPETVARVDRTRFAHAFAMALPVEQVAQSFAVLGAEGELAKMLEQAVCDHPSSPNECAIVVANCGLVSVLWAGPDAHVGILGIGRA